MKILYTINILSYYSDKKIERKYIDLNKINIYKLFIIILILIQFNQNLLTFIENLVLIVNMLNLYFFFILQRNFLIILIQRT